MTPISVYIRTLNEEARIDQVIQAAMKLTDDVIVIDSGSTDNTLEISKQHGARIVKQRWLGNGKQKRVGEDAALFDWVLDIDADEVLSDDFVQEVRDIFQTNPKISTIFSFSLVTVPPVGKPWYKFDNVRRSKLYNKTFIRVPDHKAWDQLNIPKDASIVALKHPVLHYSFKNLAHLLRKQNRVSTVRAYDTPLKSKPYVILRIFIGFPFYFLKAYLVRGQFRGGIYGLCFSTITAFGRWLKDVKMYERHKGIPRQ